MKTKGVLWVSAATILVLIGLGIYGLTADMSDRFGYNLSHGLTIDSAVLIAWVLLLYFLYDRLHMTFPIYSVMMFAILSHVFGDVYFYGKLQGIIQSDMIIHFIFGFALSLLIFRYFSMEGLFPAKPWVISLVVLLTFMGLSGFHEVEEFIGYSVLGHGGGIFYYGPGDYGDWYDSMTDMMSGALGAIFGIAISWFTKKNDGKNTPGNRRAAAVRAR